LTIAPKAHSRGGSRPGIFDACGAAISAWEIFDIHCAKFHIDGTKLTAYQFRTASLTICDGS
jgi:hypothetical protein